MARDDETLARLREVDPAPQGFVAGDGAAIVRRTPQAVSVIQIAGDAASTASCSPRSARSARSTC